MCKQEILMIEFMLVLSGFSTKPPPLQGHLPAAIFKLRGQQQGCGPVKRQS